MGAGAKRLPPAPCCLGAARLIPSRAAARPAKRQCERPADPEDVMKHEEFRLERYLSQYEFSARHLLAGSDCESYPMAEVVSWADDECRELWAVSYTHLTLPTEEDSVDLGGRRIIKK